MNEQEHNVEGTLRQGPAYLSGLAVPYNAEQWIEEEWTGQFTPGQNRTRFHILYYGELMEELIAGTEQAPQLIIAEDPDTQEQWVLFDGCRHGYDSMMCEDLTEAQLNRRGPLLSYVDEEGEDTFEIYVTAYYNIDWDEEFADEVDEEGNMELITGEKCSFDEVKRNGFDAISITVVNSRGFRTELLQEELA
ncbi:hypothetical protein [Paenibacillus massiliensis]|uniref:hypothetical protein n=1 Tax=Paenibacillus massiliensis TaxID=225917 RepID=UPI00036E02E9|nr:hypothetical protein [Paenibacillus massiliensis]